MEWLVFEGSFSGMLELHEEDTKMAKKKPSFSKKNYKAAELLEKIGPDLVQIPFQVQHIEHVFGYMGPTVLCFPYSTTMGTTVWTALEDTTRICVFYVTPEIHMGMDEAIEDSIPYNLRVELYCKLSLLLQHNS